jgi:hypothetical protein
LLHCYAAARRGSEAGRGGAPLGARGGKYTDCGAVVAHTIIPPMKSKSRAMPWWKTVMLAAIAALLSAVVTGSPAFVIDHLLWE